MNVHMIDFVAGLAHPVSGADHILAMVAVGLWGVVAGGRALWAWPLAFVATVVVGFASAVLGFTLPLVQPAIVVSIVVLGLLIALAVKSPVWLGAVLVGSFALFHGHAHGTEAAITGASLPAYATGFSLSTCALHVVGIGAGLVLTRLAGISLLRTTGVFVAVGGLLIATATQ